MALKEKEAQFELQAHEMAVSAATIRQLHEQLQNTKVRMGHKSTCIFQRFFPYRQHSYHLYSKFFVVFLSILLPIS